MRNKVSLENHRKIHVFAKKWLFKLQNGCLEAQDDFAEDCFSLGFDMDCGVVFKVTFRDENVFYDSASLAAIVSDIHDVKMLCSAIFSRWRDIQFHRIKKELMHCGSRQNSTTRLSEEETAWFVTALSRLAAITEN